MWQHWKILGDSFGGFLTIRSILYAWKNLKDIQSLPLAPGKFTASDVTQQVASGCWWRGPFLLLPFLFFLPFPPPTPLPPPPPSSSSFSLLLSFLLFLSFLPCPLRFENIQLSFLGREREREKKREREGLCVAPSVSPGHWSQSLVANISPQETAALNSITIVFNRVKVSEFAWWGV